MVMSSPNLTTLSYRFKSDQVSDDYEIQGQVFAPRSSRSQPATLIYDGLEFIIKDDFGGAYGSVFDGSSGGAVLAVTDDGLPLIIDSRGLTKDAVKGGG